VADLTQARLKELLEYDPDTGVFRWRTSRPHSRIKAGDVAGRLDKTDGYVRIGIDKTRYRAHRLAWLYVYGTLPPLLDYKDLNWENNRISNLRVATRAQDQANITKKTHNTSGLKGVFFHNKTKRWYAKICHNRRQIRLGYFVEKEDAYAAYKKAAAALFGEFARTE
jgi:hypothetical protein